MKSNRFDGDKFDYDVIIVCADPAGSTTARHINLKKHDISVLIIDMKKEVGVPVQCGCVIRSI